MLFFLFADIFAQCLVEGTTKNEKKWKEAEEKVKSSLDQFWFNEGEGGGGKLMLN